MTEQNISVLALVVRVHQFLILNFLKFLNLRFDHRVSTIGVNRFRFNRTLDLGFSLLVKILLRSKTGFSFEDLSCENIRNLVG